MNKSIVILGSGRSGTSFLSNLLFKNGVLAGQCTSGTLENLKVREINEACLTKFYGATTRSKLPYGVLPNSEIKVESEFQEKAKNFVDEMNSNTDGQWWDDSNSFWMMKDPRTTLLHDMWVKHFDVVIGVFRNPTEVVESYMKLLDVYYTGDKNVGYDNMLNYWKRFNTSLLYSLDNYDKEKYLIDFNGDVEKQIKEMCRNLGINLVNYNYNENQKHHHSSEIKDKEAKLIYERLKKYGK